MQSKEVTRSKECRHAGISRRGFLKTSGLLVLAVSAGGLLPSGARSEVAASQGYLVVDLKKCQGCTTCMLVCSLVHEGFESLSLARIQIVQDPFAYFPDDITIAQCRQCVSPACLAACPVGALSVDSNNGNVRSIDPETCIGCKACVAACPYEPGRSVWNFEQGYAQKCDLCAGAFYWSETGGTAGTQACVTLCPMQAISFTTEIPVQSGDEGYEVDLRGHAWQALGYPNE